MQPPASLLDRLSTSRLMPVRALPSAGIGERRSRQKGAGMEFIDHRPYHEGDDIRHLDAHVLARTGDPVIREYAQSRQLPVTVLLDASESMIAQQGEKHRLACEIAQVLGYVALAAGDRVQVVVSCDRGLVWSPRWQGGARAEALFSWIAEQPPGGAASFADALSQVPEHLPARGLLILLSDLWDRGIRERLDALNAAGQEVIAVQVLAAQERDPGMLGRGVMMLRDAESAEEAEVEIDESTLRRYAALLEAWQEELREFFAGRQWQFFALDTRADLTEFCMRTLRARGVLS